MTPWQVSRQIRYLLRNRKWEGNAAYELVFGAIVSAGAKDTGFSDLRFPLVVITPLGGPADPEDPKIIRENFRMVIVQEAEGDDKGEEVLIGTARSAGQGSSKGRGLLEIEEELSEVMNILSTQYGVEYLAKGTETGETRQDPELGWIAARIHRCEVLTTLRRYYHPPTRFLAVNGTGTTVDLSWELPPDRFDRRIMVLRRAAGSTPPASPTAGTGVALSSDLATSKTDDPGSTGVFSYSLFAGYLETSDVEPPITGTPDRYSAAATFTITVT